MLEINGLDGFYGNSHVLQQVNVNVPDGGFVSVLGRNGVGKTTLMRAVLG
ncbi:MAG: ATP-binding cassette domain-containing protein, partial [Alphaproteobacteria bacterium]|nr:ATP-binding cassette domain-containing protein [Alphaproteobacteria bacterium]